MKTNAMPQPGIESQDSSCAHYQYQFYAQTCNTSILRIYQSGTHVGVWTLPILRNKFFSQHMLLFFLGDGSRGGGTETVDLLGV